MSFLKEKDVFFVQKPKNKKNLTRQNDRLSPQTYHPSPQTYHSPNLFYFVFVLLLVLHHKKIILKNITMKAKCYKLILMSALFFIALSANLKAQTITPCGTDEKLREMLLKYPDLQKQMDDYNKELELAIKSGQSAKSLIHDPVVYIPVVFHIIHTNGPENIPDANIYAEIDTLNKNWSKLNADTSYIVKNSPFDTLASDMKIRFRLAKLDPNGNCTSGIDRIYSHLTHNADDASKLNQWPRDKYLNIWVIHDFRPSTSGGQAAAYAFLPAGAQFYPQGDGVISLYDYVSSLSPSTVSHSKTIVHEIGHYFNLDHVWGNGDIYSATSPCGNDGVDDTPLTKGHLGCGIANQIPVCTKQFTSQWLYNFSAVTPFSATTDPTVVPVNDTLLRTSFTAHGVSANPVDTSYFTFTKWAGGSNNGDSLASFTGSIDTSKYYEVTFTPGYSFSTVFKTISFNVKRDTAGARTFVVRSSANNYSTNLPASISPANAALDVVTATNEFYFKNDTSFNTQTGCRINFPVNTIDFTNVKTPLTFRFYAWNAEDSTGTFGIDNVKFVDTTGLIENYQNFMDYSYCPPNGQIMFTHGQEQRARATLLSSVSYRNHLWINSNLQATGTDGGTYSICVPKPDFYSNKQSVCAGGTVSFYTNITNISTTSAYTKRWHFIGSSGNPFVTTNVTAANSATQNTAPQNVTYVTAGDYPVTLTIINTSGTDSITKTSFVHVSPGWPQYNGAATESFEGSSYWNWIMNNYDNNPHAWSIVNSTGYTGSHSIAMNGYGNYHDDIDDFITPGFNLFGMTGATFSFRCAAASTALTAADLNDQLKVYKSTDCGATWQPIPGLSLTGASLSNNGYKPTGFQPNTQSQWALHSYTIPSTMALGNVRFKFEYTTGTASNNIFIDDININGTVGIIENSIDDANVNVYPNPTNESSTIYYHLNSKGNVKIELFDLIGKKVTEINNKNEGEGDYTTTISKQDNNLTNGIYFIKFSIDGKSVTRKIVFTN